MVRLLTIASAIFAVSSLQYSVVAEKVQDIDPNVVHQNHDNILFVEYYSPNCQRCNEFASHWDQASNEYNSYGRFVKLNCASHPDFCQDNGITRYPTIQAKLPNGEIKEYVDELDFNAVGKFIKDIQPKRKNSEGKSVELNNLMDLEAIIKSKEPWFIKFYAPWCGHCKHLAPTWEAMAAKLQNKVNVAEVNCEASKPICQEFKVTGLPTLSYFVHGANLKYTGERKLEKLYNYAIAKSGSPIQNVENDDELEQLLKTSDVNIVYVRETAEKKGQLGYLEQIAPQFMENIPFYTIAGDQKAISRFNLKNSDLPASVIVKDGTFYVYGEKDVHSITSWIEKEKNSLVTRVLPHNSNRILKGTDVVVLGIFDPEDNSSEIKLRALAKKYEEKKKPGNYIFGQLDGKLYGSYVGRAYGIQSHRLPALVVADPKNQVYYDKNENGDYFNMSKPDELINSITSLDKLVSISTKPSKTLSYVEKVTIFFGDHWVIMTTILFGFLGLLFYLMNKNEFAPPISREEAIAKAKEDLAALKEKQKNEESEASSDKKKD